LSRWSAKKPVLWPLPGLARNFSPFSVMMLGAGASGRAEVEALLLLHVLFGEAVEAAAGEVLAQRGVDPFAVAEHAGGEELHHQQVVVAVDDQAGQAVAFRVHHAPGVAALVQAQHVAAQGRGGADLAREPGRVDRLVRIGGEHAQGDARMAVVEAAADPGAGVVDDVDDAARLGLHGGLVDHLLEDPGMVRAPLDPQADDGQGGGLVHIAIVRGC
jgi:hypothetical protein